MQREDLFFLQELAWRGTSVFRPHATAALVDARDKIILTLEDVVQLPADLLDDESAWFLWHDLKNDFYLLSA